MKSQTRVFLSVIIFTVLTALCVGCTSLLESTSTPIPTVIEPGLAYGIPCKPPCWRGLIPGQSTHQEAAQVIEELRAEGWADHIVDGSLVGGGYSISPSPHTSHGTIDVIVEDDIVTKIHSGTLLFYYPVGALIDQFGVPEGLYIGGGQGGTTCSSCREWEPTEPPDAPAASSPVHLLFPSQGLWFLMLVPDSGHGCICPEMLVATFCYYPPRSMQEALSDDYLTTLFAALKGATEEDLVEWHGFGGGY